MGRQRAILLVATLALVGAAAFRVIHHSAGGWKTIDVQTANARMSVPASWRLLSRTGGTQDWGNSSIDVEAGPLNGNAPAMISLLVPNAEAAERQDARTDHGTFTRKALDLPAGPAQLYTDTYRQSGQKLLSWDYYIVRGYRTYAFKYTVLAGSAAFAEPTVRRSARSIRFVGSADTVPPTGFYPGSHRCGGTLYCTDHLTFALARSETDSMVSDWMGTHHNTGYDWNPPVPCHRISASAVRCKETVLLVKPYKPYVRLTVQVALKSIYPSGGVPSGGPPYIPSDNVVAVHYFTRH